MSEPTVVRDQVEAGMRGKPASQTRVSKGYSGKGGYDPSDMLDPEATFLTGMAQAGDEVEEDPTTGGEARRTTHKKGGGEAPRDAHSGSLGAATLATMDLSRISFLRKEAQKTTSGFDRAEFILAMATCLEGDLSHPVDCIDDIDVNLVADACDIFAQVDIDNDGTVSWEELSTFMIEMRMASWAKESDIGVLNYAYMGQIESARPTQAAEQIQYFSQNDTVAVIERNANFFRIYNADSMHLKRQFDIKDKIGSARSLCYCTSSAHYVLGTSASRVCFYEESSGNAWRDFKAPDTPICITHSERHNMLVAGDIAGNVFSWKMDEISAANTVDGEVPPHRSFGAPFKTRRPPKSIENAGRTLEVDGTDMVASCSMDHTVKLWDLNTLGLHKTLIGHPKGVKHLAYCPEHRLIVSGGYSYDLVINNPYAPGPVSRLRGHCAPIAGVEYVAGTSQLVTADTDGFCKVWDLRTFGCAGTFACGLAEGTRKTTGKTSRKPACQLATRKQTITCMTVSPLSRRVFVAGQTVDSFEIIQRGCEELAGDMAVRAVYFNATDLTFVTASAWAVEVWDGATGELLCADARQQRSRTVGPVGGTGERCELFSMCLGAPGGTFVIGDRLGRIKAYNAVNNTVLRTHTYPECAGKSHEGSIRALIFVEDHALLISASADRSISIHDESGRNSGALLRRTTNASWSEISVLRYSSHLGLIASGNTDGSIQVWNFEFGRHVGCCHEMHMAPVTCLAFLDPFPILLSADAAGYLALWALPPARERLRFKRIFTWVNKQPVSSTMYGVGGGADGQIPVAVTSVECQVETISASIAVSTVTGSAACTSDSNESSSNESSSLEMSLEAGDEEQEEEQEEEEEEEEEGVESGQEEQAIDRNDDGGGGAATEADPAGTPPPAPALSSGGKSPSSGEKKRRGDADCTPPEGATGTVPAETENVPETSRGGDGGGGADVHHDESEVHPAWDASVASPDPLDGGSCHDSSFQERLAATFRKYQGKRQRHTQSTRWGGRDREEQQPRVLWNTEMLSYTVYAGDESGNVTTWDLKAVILALIHIFGNHEWAGHGLDPVQSPAVYSNAFLIARWDAKAVLLEERRRQGAKASLEWVPDKEDLGLHRIGTWDAHEEPIICMNLVDDPPAVVTSAMDRLVKVWSPRGDLQGVLRQKQDQDTPWNFRVNKKAQAARKRRAAEDVIVEAKLSPPKKGGGSSAADTARTRGLVRRQLPASGQREKGHNATAHSAAGMSAASDRTPVKTYDAKAPSEQQRFKRTEDRDGSDGNESNNNGGCGGGGDDGEDSVDDGVVARGGAGGHEFLVDTSRRSAHAVRRHAEEELDRYCESSISSTGTKVVGPLRFASSSTLAMSGDSDLAGRGARRTPRRVPVRPNASGKGVTRGGVLQGGFGANAGAASGSPRAARGQLVVRQSFSLSAR